MQSSSQRIEIPLNKSRTVMMELLWLGLASGAFYLAAQSLDPFYWQTIHVNVGGTTWFMRQLPVPVRVGILGLTGVMLLLLSMVTMLRLISNAPSLVMDADGIEGFKSGISFGTVRMRWDEIGDIKSYYGNLFIYSKRESTFARRKLIAVQTASVGKSSTDIIGTMQAMMLGSRIPNSSARPSAPTPERAYDTPLPTSHVAAMARPTAQQPQVVVRTSHAMANANKPTFGTRRN